VTHDFNIAALSAGAPWGRSTICIWIYVVSARQPDGVRRRGIEPRWSDWPVRNAIAVAQFMRYRFGITSDKRDLLAGLRAMSLERNRTPESADREDSEIRIS